MSRSRQDSASSRSFLHQPINYRQLYHHRNGHSPHSSHDQPLLLPLNPRLQSLLRTPSRPAHPSRVNSPSISFLVSLSKAASRNRGSASSISPLNLLALQKNDVKVKRQSRLKAESRPQPKQQDTRHLNDPSKPAEQISRLSEGRKASGSGSGVMEEIEIRLQDLVIRKLRLVYRSTSKRKGVSRSEVSLAAQTLNHELQQLIEEIRQLKNHGTSSDIDHLNRKIRLIQTLLAEQTTEAELMKKYYFSLSSSKKQGKVGDFLHMKHRMEKAQSRAKGQGKDKDMVPVVVTRSKPLFLDSTSKADFKQPRPQDYESYRYQPKKAAPNMQPLPRSSYQREYYRQRTEPDELIVPRDCSPYYPSCKSPMASVYEKDYQTLRTEVVDYRQLDAYRDKIKQGFLKIDR